MQHQEVWAQGGYDSDDPTVWMRLNAMNRGRTMLCLEIVDMFETLGLQAQEDKPLPKVEDYEE